MCRRRGLGGISSLIGTEDLPTSFNVHGASSQKEDDVGLEMFVQNLDEVDFVMDSLASDMVVPDSQVEDVTVLGESFSEIEVDVASSLMQLHATKVSRFELDRV